MKHKKCLGFAKRVVLLVVLGSSALKGVAQEKTPEKKILNHGAHRQGPRSDAAMQNWRAYGLGQFIHWGLYSVLGGEWKGESYSGAAEWIRVWKKIPTADYDSLYQSFNPVAFQPQDWARMAKLMGAKYMILTTKHHDGFCLWPSQYTSYTIAKSPWKKDVVGPLVEAYNKEGIDVYLYFSVMDWNHKDWRTDLKTRDDSVAFDRFKLFTKNQLTELIELYPTVKGFWFDGTWDASWKKSGAFSDSLEQHMKSLRPGLIIGSRMRADDLGARHFDSNGLLMGDYEQGWERKLPKNYADVKGNDWEAVMTIPENGWGYAKKWMGHWKTSSEILEMMVHSVALNGNFVLNFGPKGDGSFRPEEESMAREIGMWMEKNATAIYDCGYAGWEKQDWGYYTKNAQGDVLNMIVFNVPVSGRLKIQPANKQALASATLLLHPAKKLELQPVDYGGYWLHLPKGFVSKEPFVIQLNTKASSKQVLENKANT